MISPLSLFGRRTGTSTKPITDRNEPTSDRPPGIVFWLHVPRPKDLPAVYNLISGFDEHPDEPWFVISNDGEMPRDLPINSFHQRLTSDEEEEILPLLDHWKPDAVLWVSDCLMQVFIGAVNERQIPLMMLDSGAAMAIARQKFRWPGVKRKALQAFNYVLAGDPATSKALIRAGAKKANVAVTGVIEPTMPALPCHDGEREDFAGLLTARPVWLAAEVTLGEAELIIAAHALAIRKTHRLLLIIVPSDAGDTPEFQKLLNQYDLIYEQRSALMDPDKETQVYLADTTDEMGLWYRLAPVSYIGGTGRGSKDPGPSPFDAAALGSAILHGPVTQAHQSQFERLSRANAAIQVVNAEDLAFAVTSLGAPDRAAEMAHSAWSVCSAGAEAIERVHDLLTVAIERRKKKP